MNGGTDVYYGLPVEVKFCCRCVISNQRPSSTIEFMNVGGRKSTIDFDEEGVCAAYPTSRIKWRAA